MCGGDGTYGTYPKGEVLAEAEPSVFGVCGDFGSDSDINYSFLQLDRFSNLYFSSVNVFRRSISLVVKRKMLRTLKAAYLVMFLNVKYLKVVLS